MKFISLKDISIQSKCYYFNNKIYLSFAMINLFKYHGRNSESSKYFYGFNEVVGNYLGNLILDDGYRKPFSEFKVYGSAYAVGLQPVREMQVYAQVDGIRKELLVYGNRNFNEEADITEPNAFNQISLIPENAFGGHGFLNNPAGKGAQSSLNTDGKHKWPLPNLEYPNQPVLLRGDVVEPAGFWGLDANHPLRKKYLGKFDDDWLRHSWPYLPKDTQPEYFMTTPPDQWFPGYLVGNESFELGGMHPEKPVISGQLPNLRGRCFIHRELATGDTEFVELPTNLDTVWFFPDQECGIVLYRAQTEVADIDAKDVLHVMAEWESLNEPAKSFAHYESLFRQQVPSQAKAQKKTVDTTHLHAEKQVAEAPAVDKPLANTSLHSAATAGRGAVAMSTTAVSAAEPENVADKAVAGGPISGDIGRDVESVGDSSTLLADMPPEFREVEQLIDALEQETKAVMDKHGLTQADVEKYLPQQEAEPVMSLAQIEKLIGELESHTHSVMQEHGLSRKDVEKYLPSEQPEEPAPSLDEINDLIEALNAQTQKVMQENGLTQEDVEHFFASKPELAEAYAALFGDKSQPHELGKLPDVLSSEQAAMAAQQLPQAPLSAHGLSGEGDDPKKIAVQERPNTEEKKQGTPPQLSREQVAERHATKASLAGFDLTGLDLSGLDLSGADLMGCLLDGAILAGCCFTNANLSDCLMQGANCQNADFSQANLTGINAASSDFSKACLAKSQLKDGNFSSANFAQADMNQAVLDGASLEQAVMSQLQAQGVSAVQANFSGADLKNADFAQANLSQAMLNECQLEAANFHAADCAHAEFYGVQAQGAQFANARLDASRADASSHFTNAVFECASLQRASWDGACLDSAMLAGATLDDADLSNVQARSASFQHASARQTKFGGAHLERADLQGANLFKASLRKAKLDDAVLQFANAFGADFEATEVKAAALQGTDIGQTILQFRPPKA